MNVKILHQHFLVAADLKNPQILKLNSTEIKCIWCKDQNCACAEYPNVTHHEHIIRRWRQRLPEGRGVGREVIVIVETNLGGRGL